MTAETADDSVKAQLVLMRAEVAHYAAQAAKAEKEARYYPAIAILYAVVGTAAVYGVAATITLAMFYLAHTLRL